MADGSKHLDIYSIDQWIDIMVGSEQLDGETRLELHTS